MQKVLILSVISLFIGGNLLSQGNGCAEKEKYYLEQAGECFNSIFESKGVDKEEFKHSFEQYFIESSLVDSQLEKGELYYQILKVLEENPDSLPTVLNARYVGLTAGRLNITIPELRAYKQLDCIKDQYLKYQKYCPTDTITGLYVLGGVSVAVQEIPELHYQLISYSIRTFTTPEYFESECLQDAVVMLFWFQTAGRYGK